MSVFELQNIPWRQSLALKVGVELLRPAPWKAITGNRAYSFAVLRFYMGKQEPCGMQRTCQSFHEGYNPVRRLIVNLWVDC